MTESDLFAAHAQRPMTARWFSLASYCLAHGYAITTYEPEKFEAESIEDDGAFLATVESDGSARWTWWWADEDEPDAEELTEEYGNSESFAHVLGDWLQTMNPR